MPLPIVSIAGMREWEKSTWSLGTTEDSVIEQVGEAIANRLSTLVPPNKPILMLAGWGRNGDDVRAAARILGHSSSARAGASSVRLIEIRDPAASLPEVQVALATNPSWVVDGLFGIGLNRKLSPEWITLIEAINASGCRILAVDLPSGLNADTAETWGSAVEADITLTVGSPKTGLINPAAAKWVGKVEVAHPVGFGPASPLAELQWSVDEDFSKFPPRRPMVAHKGTMGHVAILAGSLGYHGAAVLAARGALKARPGLVTLATMPEVYLPAACQLQQAMVRVWQEDVWIPARTTAMVVGPGLAGAATRNELGAEISHLWLTAKYPIVIDASALDWLPLGIPVDDVTRVITPHPGEAARLLGSTVDEVERDRLGTVRELSRRFGQCWVILKGRHTLIGAAEGPVYVNGSGNPGMAQGGSGDVLAGFMGGLLAQPALSSNPSLAIRYAVWHHGRIADHLELSGRSWLIEDLIAEL